VRATVLTLFAVLIAPLPARSPAAPADLPAPAAPAVGSEAVVADPAAGDATASNNQPKLARDRAGALVAAYVAVIDGVPQIVLARSPDGGRRWTRMAQASGGPVPSRLAALAGDRQGRLHVVWTRYDDGVGKIYYRRWSGRWDADQQRISPAATYAGFPGLAVTGSGLPQVVWYGIRTGEAPAASRHGSIYEIFYTGLAGRTWSRPQLISTGIPDSLNPAAAAGPAGALYAAWFQYDGRTYQVRYAERHTGWSAPETVLATRGDAFSVDLAAGGAGAGVAVLAWERHDAQTSVIEATQRRGAGWTDAERLSAGAPPARHPSVSVAPSGAVYIAWDTDDGDVYVRRRDAGARWGPPRRVGAGRVNSYPSVLASDAGADVIWTHTAGGRASVRYARVGP
jgi:hypothetical protein